MPTKQEGHKVMVMVGGPTIWNPSAPPAEEIEVELIGMVSTDGREIILDEPKLSHGNAVVQATRQEAERASVSQ